MLPLDLYFPTMKFTLLAWTSRSVTTSHIKFTLFAWPPRSITPHARYITTDPKPIHALRSTRNRSVCRDRPTNDLCVATDLRPCVNPDRALWPITIRASATKRPCRPRLATDPDPYISYRVCVPIETYDQLVTERESVQNSLKIISSSSSTLVLQGSPDISFYAHRLT